MAVDGVMIWGESGFLRQVSNLYRVANTQLEKRQQQGADSSKPLHIQWIPNISPPPRLSSQSIFHMVRSVVWEACPRAWSAALGHKGGEA